MKKYFFVVLIIFLLETGCAARAENPSTFTATAVAATATVSRPSMPPPSETPFSPPPQPTHAPVEGTTSTQVNVRAEPSTAGNVLGVIPVNTLVQITGKDPAGNWWQILYPQGQDGKGWVTAQYVTTANATAVPIIGGGMDPGSGGAAVVQQQINVRSGPGTGFHALGTLNARDVVRLTGRDASAAWLQIEFASGPDGKGWVNAAFVQATGVESLPIITEAGEVIGTGTPTGIPPTPTATVVPARLDQDSQDHPIASVLFEPLGTRTMIYSGDVSSPEGDREDWVRFTPYTDIVYASLDCPRSTPLQISLLENSQFLPVPLSCGEKLKPIPVQAGSASLIRLQAPQSSGGVQYIAYAITIQSSP